MTNDGRTMTGYPIRSASVSASSIECAMPPSGCGMPSRSRRAQKRTRSSAWSIASSDAPRSGTPADARRAARLSGVWPPNWTKAGSGSAPCGDSASMIREDALGVERLEVEAAARVEVGRDRLRVRVHDDRRPAQLAERVGCLDGAVVELDPLPDPDGARADDERGRPGDRRRLRR